MNKIRVIDILNKIANGEEVPHFELEETEYYVGADGYLKDETGDIVEWAFFPEWLNEEVKLLEDTPNEMEKLNIDAYESLEIKALARRINQIIDYINELRKGDE